MVMDKFGTNLYFGSAHELMEYSAFSNSLAKQDPNAPGIVLAVSPSNTYLLINDQARHLFYIYPVGGGSSITFGGMGNAAAWTPDEKTLYIVDNANLNSPGYVQGQPAPAGCPATPLITGHSDTLYVYSQGTGWATYPLPPSPLPLGAQPTCNTPPNVAGNLSAGNPINLGSYPPIQTPAITIPSVGAYLRGIPTVSHTWCPSGQVGGALQFYPLADSVAAQSDVLAATTDGSHILGASLFGAQINLADINVSVPSGANGQCPGAGTNTLSPLLTNGKLNGTVAINKVVASAVNQVIASPASNLAFITYSGAATGASLPYYTPSPTGVGKVGYVTLTGSANITAPLAGAFTPDDQLFFVSTSGDNLIHYISVPTLTDTQQIAPNLPACTPIGAGGNDQGCTYTGNDAIVPTTAITVKPRSTT
jgi:sugar lactone lactonase YvrE